MRYLACKIIGGRESEQPVIIVPGIAECYEAFVPAAVMPLQVACGHAEREAVIKYAFQVFLFVIFLYVISREEIGRWHLFRIAYYYYIRCTGDSANGLASGHLGSFVENDEIEFCGISIKVLRYGYWAHEHARAQTRQQVGYGIEQPPDRHAAATVPYCPS